MFSDLFFTQLKSSVGSEKQLQSSLIIVPFTTLSRVFRLDLQQSGVALCLLECISNFVLILAVKRENLTQQCI